MNELTLLYTVEALVSDRLQEYALVSVPMVKQFLVFMWRNHIPKLKTTFPSEVLVASDKRSYRTTVYEHDV